ncbi:hypothetical protein DPMN_051181 [Dreissena polymorpha]|uniref:Uncharacterized protein n=1 Tax=Dreissena polymorpha TaxID=45954 RepID=A0A9D4CIX1_DREPO|nr:hypothetical protein DPMN_051181 [Dreissena polymorpha]
MDTVVPDPSPPRIKIRDDPWPFGILFYRRRSSNDHRSDDITASTRTDPVATRTQRGAYTGSLGRTKDLPGKDTDKQGPSRDQWTIPNRHDNETDKAGSDTDQTRSSPEEQ